MDITIGGGRVSVDGFTSGALSTTPVQGSNFVIGAVRGSVVVGDGAPPAIPTPAAGSVVRQAGWAVVATTRGSVLTIGPGSTITIGGAPADPEDLVRGALDVVIDSATSTYHFDRLE